MVLPVGYVAVTMASLLYLSGWLPCFTNYVKFSFLSSLVRVVEAVMSCCMVMIVSDACNASHHLVLMNSCRSNNPVIRRSNSVKKTKLV